MQTHLTPETAFQTNDMNEAKEKLISAELKSKALLNAIEERGLIVAGKSEQALAEEIAGIASTQFGIETYWHKKIVRTGSNTIYPYNGNPPDRLIQPNDILFIDLGPIVEGWEADLGRTYILGNDPLKIKLKRDVEAAWEEARIWYKHQGNLTGAAYFNYITELATKYGWTFGGEIAGHIVGHYPHEQLEPGDMGLDIHPDNHADIKQPDKNGNERHWILEIQFIDPVNNMGAYFEQLLY
jgi:Xaa-Pro aminopeptidase